MVSEGRSRAPREKRQRERVTWAPTFRLPVLALCALSSSNAFMLPTPLPFADSGASRCARVRGGLSGVARMQLPEDRAWPGRAGHTRSRRPAAGWGLAQGERLRGAGLPRPAPSTQRDMSKNMPGALPGTGAEYILYNERWLMLAIVSALALLSDWACFASVGGTKTWVNAFHENPEELIDTFLFANVLSCFCYTDLTRRFGLKNVITVAAGLMAVGCSLRSGLHPMNLLAINPLVAFNTWDWSLPDYSTEIVGTILIGIAQPFFQCAPPLLSATWFGNKERSLSTAICLNANQLGIATSFVVGAGMLNSKTEGLAAPAAMDEYLSIITVCATIAFGATVALFKERPPTPPTGSAAAHIADEDARRKAVAKGAPDPWFTYPKTAVELFRTPGFLAPTAAFVGSIGVTNAVSAFTSDFMHRAGFLRETVIDELGASFQVAVMAGGILLGGYVDRTKEFKSVTLGCFAVTLAALAFLGVGEGYDLNLPQWGVVGGLLTLGAAAGPIQPINAELAVEVSYPSDENAVEATQQLCGNLFSAILVPLCVWAAKADFEVLGGLWPRADMRGDTLVLMALAASVMAFFTSFNAPLLRAQMDAEDVELPGSYLDQGGYTEVCRVWRRAAIFDSFDVDAFAAFAANQPDSLYQETRDLFQRLDVNQDGKICREEFIQGFPELDDSTVSELISEADADGDGNIDFDELWSVVQTVAAQEVTVLEGSRKLKLDSLPRSKAGQDVGSP